MEQSYYWLGAYQNSCHPILTFRLFTPSSFPLSDLLIEDFLYFLSNFVKSLIIEQKFVKSHESCSDLPFAFDHFYP